MCEKFGLLLDQIIKISLEKGIINSTDIAGMTPNEILHLEDKFKVKLPDTYKYFLSTCGKDGGELINNSLVYCCPSLLDLRGEVQEMIEEDIYDPIAENAFFFASLLGVYYWYFICDGNPDPDVYVIAERNKKHAQFVELSDFIIQTLEESIQR